MRIDNRFITAPLLALSFAVACGDSETMLGARGTGGSDSGSDTGGSSTSTGGSSTSTGGSSTGTGGRTAGTGGRGTGGGSAGGSSGSGNGGSSGSAGADASAGGGSGDGGPPGDGSAAGGNAGAGGSAAGGAGGRAAGGAGGRAAGGAGGRGTGGSAAGTACERLADCCATVPAAVRTQCNTYVTANQQPQCGVVLGVFCPSADAGPPTPQDAANACSALSACCPTAGANQAQCEQTVSLANPGICNLILSVLCP
jgi:hypothetical protein